MTTDQKFNDFTSKFNDYISKLSDYKITSEYEKRYNLLAKTKFLSIKHVDGNTGLSPEIIDAHNVTAWLLRGLPLLV